MKITITSWLPRTARSAPLGLAFVVSSLLAAPPAKASERWATIEAIHQLENPTDSEVPGSLGELGPYQFREETWKMHTQVPFRRALDRRASDVVAVKHYEWIRSELASHGVVATPYNVALAWNGGIGAVLDTHPPAGAVDYANRAANLTALFQRGQLADAH